MLKNISCLWAVISTITILQACASRSPTIPLAGEISADAADYVIIEGTVGNSRYRVLSYNPLGDVFFETIKIHALSFEKAAKVYDRLPLVGDYVDLNKGTVGYPGSEGARAQVVKTLSRLISQFLAIQENHPEDVKKIMAYTNSHALKELVDRQMSDYQRDYPDRVFTFDLILNPIFMDGVVAAASFDEKRGMLKGHIEINILTVLNMLLGKGQELTRAVDYALAREIAHVFHSFGGGRGSRDGEKPLLNRMAVNQVLIDEGQAAYFGALYSDSRDRYPLIIHPAYAKEEVRIPEFKREVARMYLDSAFNLYILNEDGSFNLDALGVYDSWYAVNSDPAARPKEDYPMLIYYLGYEVMKYLEDHDGWQTLLPKGVPKKMGAIGEISVEELRPYIKEALEYMAGVY